MAQYEQLVITGSGNPTGNVNGKVGYIYIDTDTNDEYESLGGTSWRIIKSNNVPLISREVKTVTQLKNITDLTLGERVYIKEREAAFEVIHDRQLSYLQFNRINGVRYETLDAANSALSFNAGDIFTMDYRFPSTADSADNTYYTFETRVGAEIQTIGCRNRGGKITFNDLATEISLVYIKDDLGFTLDPDNLPYDTWFTVTLIVNNNITTNSPIRFRCPNSDSPVTNDSQFHLRKFTLAGEEFLMDGLASGTSIIGDQGTVFNYVDPVTSASPDHYTSFLNVTEEYDIIEIDNASIYNILGLKPESNTITPQNLGAKFASKVGDTAYNASPVLNYAFNSRYAVNMTGAIWYCADPIYIDRSKNIIGKGIATPRESSTFGDYDSSTIFTDNKIDLINIRESGVNIFGLVLDYTQITENDDIDNIFGVLYWYKDVLIQESTIDVKIKASESNLKSGQYAGVNGVGYDSARENPLQLVKNDGEIHFLNISVRGEFLNHVYRASNRAIHSKLELPLTTTLSGAVETTITVTGVPNYIGATGVKLAIKLDNNSWLELEANSRTGDDFTIPATNFATNSASSGNIVRVAFVKSNNTHIVFVYNAGGKRGLHVEGTGSTSRFIVDFQSRHVHPDTLRKDETAHAYIDSANCSIDGYAHDVGKADIASFTTHQYFLVNKHPTTLISPLSYNRHYENGQIIEYADVSDTAIMKNAKGLTVYHPSTILSAVNSFITPIDNILSSFIERGGTFEVNWYQNDGSFNTGYAGEADGQTGATKIIDGTLGSIDSNVSQMFRYSSEFSKPEVTVLPLFDKTRDFIEIKLTDFSNGGYIGADIRKIGFSFANSAPTREVHLIILGDTNRIRSFTDPDSLWENQKSYFDDLGGNNNFGIIIRLVGLRDNESSFKINGIYAKAKEIYNQNLPFINVEGGQEIFGSIKATNFLNDVPLPNEILSTNNISKSVDTLNNLLVNAYILSGRTPSNYRINPNWSNAAIAFNESDTVDNVSFSSNIGVTVVLGGNGSQYYLSGKLTVTGGSSFQYYTIRMDTHTDGNYYKFKFDAKVNAGNTRGRFVIDNGGLQQAITNTEWKTYEFVIQAGASKPEARWYPNYNNNVDLNNEIHLDNFSVLEVIPEVDTGTDYELNYETGRSYNLTAPESSTAFTFSNLVIGGKVKAKINTATKPTTVTSNTTEDLSRGLGWIANKDMFIVAETLDGKNITYWFEVADNSVSILYGNQANLPQVNRIGFKYYHTDLSCEIYHNGNEVWVKDGYQVIGTTSQRPAGVYTGYKYYDTDTSGVVIWNGTSWV